LLKESAPDLTDNKLYDNNFHRGEIVIRNSLDATPR
jgi:hypothetical protein